MNFKGQYTLKHYIWLLLWGFCLYYAIAQHSIKIGVVFLLVFFFLNSYKKLFWSIVIGVAVGFLASLTMIPVIGPFIGGTFFVLAIIGTLLKIKFIISHIRILLIGVYVYGVHFAVLAINMSLSFLQWIHKSAEYSNAVGMATDAEIAQTVAETTSSVADAATFTTSGIIIAIVGTFILHLMIKSCYKNGYSTDKIFTLMGLSPLIIASTVFPFLSHQKIMGYDVTGDSVFEADSLEEAAETISETEAGVAATTAHSIHKLSKEEEKERLQAAGVEANQK